MIKTFKLKTSHEASLHEITEKLNAMVWESKVKEGILTVFVPHTTAAVTINENADPSVIDDMLLGLEAISPDRHAYRHLEGNSKAHIKASLIGASETIMIQNNKLLLGTWQGVYFCEFDGPRTRTVHVKVLEG